MVLFETNGKENGKTAYLVKKPFAGTKIRVGSIVFDGEDWILRAGTSRVDRFGKLKEAKEEAMKF